MAFEELTEAMNRGCGTRNTALMFCPSFEAQHCSHWVVQCARLDHREGPCGGLRLWRPCWEVYAKRERQRKEHSDQGCTSSLSSCPGSGFNKTVPNCKSNEHISVLLL